ncbi:MAG: hypothetical protein DRQ56_06370 [Gammaproteobacteria bacterium]|nr:MAG: hypothetical protein DRQ56_06370 [Gammaproteobacteria bacterium]
MDLLKLSRKPDGTFVEGEGVELIRNLFPAGFDDEVNLLFVSCPGVCRGEPSNQSVRIDYAGPSRDTLRQIREGQNPIVFADANRGGLNHSDRSVFSIRWSGELQVFVSPLVRQQRALRNIVGPDCEIEGLRGLRY